MSGGKAWWVITVGGGYGSFALYCDHDMAERFRRHKARWEGAVARLRLADDNDANEIAAARRHPCIMDDIRLTDREAEENAK